MTDSTHRTACWLVFCCFAVAFSVHGQGLMGGEMKDTSSNRLRLIDPGISSGRPVFLLPPTLSIIPDDFSVTEERGFTSVPPFLASSVTGKIDLIAPFKLQLAKQNELHTLRSILGTVQLGAVGYLAYKQIKRWGKK
jgi:hypothetical protein